MSGRLGHIALNRRGGHVPVNGIRPTNYAYGFGGCLLWMDASSFVNNGNPVDGVAVTSWASKLANGIVFTQSNASNQFNFKSSIAALNNLPSIQTNGSQRFMVSNQTVSALNFTLVFVGQRTGAVDQANVICQDIGSGGSLASRNWFGAGGNFTAALTGYGYYNSIAGATAYLASTNEDANPHIVVINNSQIVIDGAVVASGSITVGMAINGLGYNNIKSLDGYISELILYNNQIDALTICSVLNNKYAIY